MDKNWLYTNDFIEFSFICDKSLKKRRVYKKDLDDNYEVIVELDQFRHGKNKRCVIFARIQNKKNTCGYRPIFYWRTPYVLGQKYELEYGLKGQKIENLKYISYDIGESEIFTENRSNITKKGPFLLRERMHPKDAKLLYKYLKEKNLVSSMVWDSYMSYHDCYCKVCKSKSRASWLGNPDIGFVRPTDKAQIDTFEYLGKLYNPCKDDEYNRVRYWNKEEYLKTAQKYYPTIEYSKWYSLTEFDEKLAKYDFFAKKVGMDTFNSLWEKNKYWRFINTEGLEGKVFKNGEMDPEDAKKMNMSTASTKVVTLAFKEFEQDFPDFDKFWKKNPLSQPEIESNGNIYGGGWRELETGKVIGRETDNLLDTSKYEKVITKGWHATDPKNAIRCPVCDDLYDIMRSGYKMVPWHLRLKEPFLKARDKKRKEKDPQYGL